MKEGDSVRIKVPIRPDTYMLWQYQGKSTKVTKKRTLFKNGNYVTAYYELANCKSEWNIPYGFMEDWLIKEGL